MSALSEKIAAESLRIVQQYLQDREVFLRLNDVRLNDEAVEELRVMLAERTEAELSEWSGVYNV